MECVLAIDLGTSSTKILAVDRSGEVVARTRIGHDTHHPGPDAAEQDPDTWWANIIGGIRQLVSPGGIPLRIAAIGVTGQMHGLVVRNDNGSLLHPAITWQDRRSTEQVRTLGTLLPEDAAARISPGFQVASWLWLRGAFPELSAQSRQMSLPKDDIIWRLTGMRVTDPSDAIGTGTFDPATEDWDPRVLATCEIDAELLPEIVPGGTIVGTVCEAVARELRLAGSPPVVIAGGDAAAGAFGVAATPERPLLMLSTGCQILQPHAGPPDAASWPSADPTGTCPWLRTAATLNGGNAITWARSVFGEPAPEPNPDLQFLPYLAGERWSELVADASGAFVGLRPVHDRGALSRAVFDGVSLAIADAFERAGGAIGGSQPLLVGSGGTRDAAWLSSVTWAFGRDLEIVSEPDLSAWGAARSAATALGWIDPGTSPDRWRPQTRRFTPPSAQKHSAEEQLRAFQELSLRLFGVQA